MKAASTKLVKQLEKRDKKLLYTAKVQRETMASISTQNQLVITKLQTQLEQVLQKRAMDKPSKRSRKRTREQSSSKTTVSTDQGPKIKVKPIPRRSATVSKPDTSEGEVVQKRRYSKFQSKAVLGDDNNNTLSSDSSEEVIHSETPDTSYLPELLRKKVTHQNFSRSRSVHYTQLVSNLVKTCSINPEVITQDHKGEDKIPISHFMEDRIQRLNTDYNEQVFDSTRSKRPAPTQPVFFSRFAVSTDNTNIEENSPFYGSNIPEDFCMMLSEKSAPITDVVGGQINLTSNECRNIEGSLSYNRRLLDLTCRTELLDQKLMVTDLKYIEQVKEFLLQHDAPEQLVTNLGYVTNSIGSIFDNANCKIEALTSVIDHNVYAHATLESARRSRLLAKTKLHPSMDKPEVKRLLRSSAFCTNDLVDPAICVDILQEARSNKEGSYIQHKGNNSIAMTSTAASSVAESSTLGELSLTTQTAPESGVDYIPEYDH